MTSITNEIRIFFSEIRRFYRGFLKETENINFSDREKAKIRWDYIKELLRHRYRFDEYFYQYEFPKLNRKDRAEFISRSEMQFVYRKNGDAGIREIFRDKAKFLEVFKPYIKRSWMRWCGPSDESKKKLRQFFDDFDCIVKPLTGTLGVGVKKIARNSISNLDRFIQENLVGDDFIIEECIAAHPEIAEFHPASLNTIRVVTFSNGKKAKVFGAFLRMGNQNRCIDNCHGGGVFAQIDVDSGMIVSDGIDTNNNHYEYHPFSNKKIKGFVVPDWEKVKELCVGASLALPKIRFAGWDVAIREDGDMEFIEGNHAPDFDVMQSPLKIGVRKKSFQIYGRTAVVLKNILNKIGDKK